MSPPHARDRSDDRLFDALEADGSYQLERVGHERYELHRSGDGEQRTWLTTTAEWMSFESEIVTGAGQLPIASLAERNALLDGPAKWVADPFGSGISVRADVARNRDEAPEALAALESMHVALAGLDGSGCVVHPEPHADGAHEGAGAMDVASLRDACAGAGFTCHERGDQLLLVDLGVSGAARLAQVEPLPHRSADRSALRIHIELLPYQGNSIDVHRALAWLALFASAEVRLARGGVANQAQLWAPGFEVRLPANPTPEVVERALASLATACGRFGRELEALEEEHIARRWLSARGLGD